MKNPVFTGSNVAIVTPYNKDGINYKALAELIEFQIANKTDSITICGTTGEMSTMSDDEHRSAIKFCVNTVAKRVPVVAGTGSNDTLYALEMTVYARDVGADAVLMVTPYYNKTTQTGLIKHFTYIADHVDIPIIVYNVPSRTGMTIQPETYAELCKHKNINGVKEAQDDLGEVALAMMLCGNEFNFWSGRDDTVVPLMSLGGKGVISTAANVIPRQFHDMCICALNGDFKTAGEMQLRYLPLIDALFAEVNPIPVKTALNHMGFDAGLLRMPLFEMSAGNKAKLVEALERLNVRR